MGAPTIISGLNTFWPVTVAKTRANVAIIGNGVDYWRRWDGMTASAEYAGIEAPKAKPILTDTGSGSVNAGAHVCGYRFLDDELQPGSLSPVASVTATGGQLIQWTKLQQPLFDATRPIWLELYRSTTGTTDPVYRLSATGHAATITVSDGYAGALQFTTSAAHGFNPGDIVTISGHSISSYNTTFTVAALQSTTTFTVNEGVSSTGINGTATRVVTRFRLGGAVTSSASDGGGTPKVVLTLPANHGVAVGEQITLSGHSVAGYNTTHTVTAVTRTTATTSVGYTADGSGGTWTVTGFMTDSAADSTISDSTLVQYSKLVITNTDASLNARRFTPPPDYKAVAVLFQDRMFYLVDVVYTAGTVTTNGTTTIAGAGTAWTSAMVGRQITIAGETTPFTITAVGSATSLTIHAAAATSASGKAYKIRPDPTIPNGVRHSLLYSEPDEPESVPTTNRVTLQTNIEDDDEITAGIPMGNQLIVARERHLYAINFERQPRLDARPRLLCSRGLFNQRCWDVVNGVLFGMDQYGAWMWSGGGEPTSISGPVQDYWRDGTFQTTLTKWFFVEYDPNSECVLFGVTLDSVSESRPRHCLRYHVRTGAWSLDQYPWALGGLCRSVDNADRVQSVGLGENDNTYILGSTVQEHTANPLRFTATASGASTVTAGGQTLTSDMVDASIYVVAGKGKDQERRISAIDNGTKVITVASAWTTAPDTTSVLVVGGVAWSYKTGQMEMPVSDVNVNREINATFSPTTDANAFDAQVFFDNDSALDFQPQDFGGVVAVVPRATTDATFNMTNIAGQRGYGLFRFSGRRDGTSIGYRYLTVNLKGCQYGSAAADKHRIHPLEIRGAK